MFDKSEREEARILYRTQIWTFRLRFFRWERKRDHTIGIGVKPAIAGQKIGQYTRIIILVSYIGREFYIF